MQGGVGGPLAIAIAGGYPYEFAEGEFGWNLGEFGTRSVPGNANREEKERGHLYMRKQSHFIFLRVFWDTFGAFVNSRGALYHCIRRENVQNGRIPRL